MIIHLQYYYTHSIWFTRARFCIMESTVAIQFTKWLLYCPLYCAGKYSANASRYRSAYCRCAWLVLLSFFPNFMGRYVNCRFIIWNVTIDPYLSSQGHISREFNACQTYNNRVTKMKSQYLSWFIRLECCEILESCIEIKPINTLLWIDISSNCYLLFLVCWGIRLTQHLRIKVHSLVSEWRAPSFTSSTSLSFLSSLSTSSSR